MRLALREPEASPSGDEPPTPVATASPGKEEPNDLNVDSIEGARKFAEGAREFQDWRVMLDEMEGELDSVHVSTPDHMHAAISMAALARGLHVYCQKPLRRCLPRPTLRRSSAGCSSS